MTAVGFHFQDQLVVVQRLTLTGRLDAVGDALDRRVESVDGDEADRRVFRTVAVGRDVALAVIDRELHAHRSAVVQRAEHVVGVQDFDVGRGFDLTSGHRAGARGAQGHALRTFGVHAHGQLLDIQNDVDDVFTDAFERGEFVHHAIDLDGGDGGALQRREENATQSVAERHAEAALERFGDDTGLASRIGAGFDLRLLRTDQLVPVSFDHVVGSLERGSPAAVYAAGEGRLWSKKY